MRLLTEESVIFLSIFKWTFLAIIIGILVGGMASFFLKALSFLTLSVETIPQYYYFLPFAISFCVLLVYYISPDSDGHGTEKVIQAVHKRSGLVRVRVIPIKLITTFLTLIFGGSVGKEGPCAQIGAGLSSLFSNVFRFNPQDRKKLVICGISSGFAAVFGTPIAGAVFGVEVLFVGGILYEVLMPSFIAGMVSYQVASFLGIHYSFDFLPFTTDFNPLFFVKVVAAGVFFGIVSLFFVELLKFSEHMTGKIKLWPPLKGLIGGVLLIGIAQFISPDYLGLGHDLIERSLTGGEVIWAAFIIKAIATSITLSFGGSGGVLTPIFVIGACSGVFFSEFFGLDPVTFAAIGLVSVLAGAANTPISACILAVELFGPELASFAAVSCVVSFLMTGHRSVFPSQVLATTKGASFQKQVGSQVDCIETQFQYKTRRVMVSMLQAIKKTK